MPGSFSPPMSSGSVCCSATLQSISAHGFKQASITPWFLVHATVSSNPEHSRRLCTVPVPHVKAAIVGPFSAAEADPVSPKYVPSVETPALKPN